jgi:subtilisin family serine protease
MFKLHHISAAILAALSTNAFALDDDTTSTDSELQAVAIPTPITTGSTLIKAAPTSAETRARSVQGWLNQINKPYANQLGSGNGAGVTVGVVDSGLQINHPTLKGQVLATYNAFTGGTDVTDQMGHGTHVSGIIAGSLANGSLTEGVAPGAKLVMAKVFTTGSSSTTVIQKGIDWVVNVQKAPIVSLSLGSSAPSMQSSLQNAVNKGTLITAALGNDGRSSGSWPAAFAKEAWAKNQIIAVGALDANNKRASFSNYDATLANWTVFAPGVNVASSYSTSTVKDAYVYMSGTSMATPIVAGQAALIKSNWNFLSAADLAQVIFQSATHLCSDNVAAATCAARKTADKVYGWGLVNVAASLQPIGGLNLGTKTGATVSYTNTALSSSKGGQASGLKGVNAVAVDKFNRGFVVNIGASVSGTTVSTGSTPTAGAGTTTTAKGVKFSAEYAALPSTQNALGLMTEGDTGTTLAKMSYSHSNALGSGYGLGLGGSTEAYFGLASTGTTPLSLNGEASTFNTPYLGLAPSASHAGYSMGMHGGWVVRMGFVGSGQSTTTLTSTSPAQVGLLEVQKTTQRTTHVLSIGQLQETDAALGMSGTGAFALGAQTNTTFITYAGSADLGARTRVSFMATMGTTAGYDNQATSVIDQVTASESAAWSVGLAHRDWLRDGDQLGLSVSMPLRTMGGSMHITTAVAQSQVDGSLQYATQSIGLAPTGTERDLQLSYSTPTRWGGTLTALAQVKYQPGHDAEAPTQYGVGLKFVKNFR